MQIAASGFGFPGEALPPFRGKRFSTHSFRLTGCLLYCFRNNILNRAPDRVLDRRFQLLRINIDFRFRPGEFPNDHLKDWRNRRQLPDHGLRNLLADLFRNERDPIQLIRQKEIYELLEATTDRCEDVADVIQNVSVKNN